MENLILNMLKISAFLNANEKFILASAVDSSLAALLKFAGMAFAEKAFMKRVAQTISQYEMPFSNVFYELGNTKSRLQSMEKEGGGQGLLELLRRVLVAVDEIYSVALKKKPGMESKWGESMREAVEQWKMAHAEALSDEPPKPEEPPKMEL